MSAFSLTQPELKNLHQYQYDGTHRNPNECALCAMAMLVTAGERLSGKADFALPAAELGRFLDRIPFRYPRFPAWFPGPGGATHPLAALWGLRSYARKLERQGTPFAWRPRLRTRQTRAQLEAALAAGQPTLIYGVGSTGIPHVVVPVQRVEGGWVVLDPGSPGEQNPKRWSDAQLDKWWANFSFIYPAGTMVTLEREENRD
jgi:hypothetical protein